MQIPAPNTLKCRLAVRNSQRRWFALFASSRARAEKSLYSAMSLCGATFFYSTHWEWGLLLPRLHLQSLTYEHSVLVGSPKTHSSLYLLHMVPAFLSLLPSQELLYFGWQLSYTPKLYFFLMQHFNACWTGRNLSEFQTAIWPKIAASIHIFRFYKLMNKWVIENKWVKEWVLFYILVNQDYYFCLTSFLGYRFTFAEIHRGMIKSLSRRVFMVKANAVFLKVNLRTFKIETGRRAIIRPSDPFSLLVILLPLALASSIWCQHQ